jgi:hypothetical protein
MRLFYFLLAADIFFLTQLVACMSTSFWRTLDPKGCRIIRIVCDKHSVLLSCISIVSVDL